MGLGARGQAAVDVRRQTDSFFSSLSFFLFLSSSLSFLLSFLLFLFLSFSFFLPLSLSLSFLVVLAHAQCRVSGTEKGSAAPMSSNPSYCWWQLSC